MQTNQTPSTLLILNYHHVAEKNELKSLYDVSTAAFKEHLSILHNEGILPVDLEADSTYTGGQKFQLALSFDDGNVSDIETVAPLLSNYNFKAGFFPIIGQLNKPGRISENQLLYLVKAGHHIGSHGMSHEILTKTPKQQLEFEFKNSKQLLEQMIEKPVHSFAFPYGQYNSNLLAEAQKAGYNRLYTTGLKFNQVNTDTKLFFRWNMNQKTSIEQFLSVVTSKGAISPSFELQNKLQQIGLE